LSVAFLLTSPKHHTQADRTRRIHLVNNGRLYYSPPVLRIPLRRVARCA